MQNPAAAHEASFQANAHDYRIVVEAMSQLVRSGREDLLEPWLRRANTLEPHRPETVYHQALAHELAGRFTDAIASWRLLETIAPEIDPYQLGLARALLGNLELTEALAHCERALVALASDTALASPIFDRRVYVHQFHIIASEIFLRLGDIRGCAYLLAQTQIRCPSYLLPDVAIWNGQPLAGMHILITACGGYGDQLLLASILPYLGAIGCRITLTVHPDLRELFVASLPGIRIIAEPMPTTLHKPASPVLRYALNDDPPDYQATMLHLPLMRAVAGTQGSFTFPPYLRVQAHAAEAAAGKIAGLRSTANGRPLVGLAWDRLQRRYPELTGAVEAARTERTSLPAQFVARITEAPQLAEHYHFVALHEFDHHRARPDPLPQNLSLASIKGGDFAYTAAIVDACDVVLSVDMSVANLAAMLGNAPWMMLAREGDWRWGVSGASPWIDCAQIFRQPTSGAWSAVVDQVIKTLAVRIPVYS